MKESFVIHAEYIEDLPEENKAEFLMYIYNYGIKGEEPALDGFARTIWIKIKRRIDFDTQEWERTKENRSSAGRKGGLKSGEARSNAKQDEANEAMLQYAKQDEANEAVYVYVNDNVNDNVKGDENGEPKTAPENAPSPSSFSALQTELYKKITEHNASVPVESRVPISSSFLLFIQKECRELFDVMKGSPPGEILETVENLLISAKEKRKRKYTWFFFLKDINDYRPGFFVDKTAAPVELDPNGFYMLMKDNPRFKLGVFGVHQNDWITAGKPCGEEYFKLQDAWEGIKNAS